MNRIIILLFLIGFIVRLPINITAQGIQIKSPEAYFGFKPGDDRKLIDYEQLIEYLETLEQVKTTNHVSLQLIEIGHSPMGKPMYIAFISSGENITRLDELKGINKQLAMNPDLSPHEVDALVEDGKVFVLATLSMHSTEVGPSQSAPLIAYDLLTTDDPDRIKWLDDVVFMMVPCHNPDGMDMIVDHYRKYVGTKYEGSSMPGIYHKYVGHDNNRDFVTLSQEDTKAIAEIYNTEWFPQIMVEKHQMGSTGVRYFVPPPHDPIAENIDAGIWNWAGIFGSNMITDMTNSGLQGISQHYLFDDYWPGSTTTSIWKNTVGFLTEAASVRTATPIYIEENELRAWGKGLSEYKKGINMPEPWPGGWWQLSDIVNYEIASINSMLKTAANHKVEILIFRNELCKKEVERGLSEAPFYYIMPAEQHDESELAGIVNLMIEHGVHVYKLDKELQHNHSIIEKGSIVIPLSQPYRPFIKEVMEKQKFPLRHYTPKGEIIKPYDITSWSLPLHRGVTSVEVNEKIEGIDDAQKPIENGLIIKTYIPEDYKAAMFSVNNNGSYRAAFKAVKEDLKVGRMENGNFLIIHDQHSDSILNEIIQDVHVTPIFIDSISDKNSKEFTVPRIALVETNMHDMDAGWTRYVFDTYEIPFTVVKPGDFEKTDFIKDFDVVVFPSANKSILMEGKYKSEGQLYPTSYPPEFTKGIGKKGMGKLMEFFEKGGIIVSWGRSTELFTGSLSFKHGDETEDFRLPVKDISKSIRSAGVYCPGSLVKLEFKKDHPLTLGMEESAGVFFRGSPVFSTSIPRFDMDRRVIGKFPEENILMSGYCENPEKLGNKTAMVWIKKGRGQIVLFGFNPQFRASTQGTYKLLFNALLLERL